MHPNRQFPAFTAACSKPRALQYSEQLTILFLYKQGDDGNNGPRGRIGEKGFKVMSVALFPFSSI